MDYRKAMMLSLLSLLLLSACGGHRVSPQGLTLGAVGTNMQDRMNEALAENGYSNIPPSASVTDPSELRWNPSLTQSNQ